MKKLICFFFGHKWTCKAEKGLSPTDDQIKTVQGFVNYAKMYCDRCGHESKLNNRLNSQS